MVEWQRFRFVVAGAALFCARDAVAQSHRGGRGQGPAQGSSQGDALPPSAQFSSSNAGDLAETRMKAGDCAGALDAFDAALRTSTQPELRRDRGVCHEKLGHPYPAIEDYRAYLTQAPNAPDADTIRARVAALETQVGIVKPGQAGVSDQSGAAITTSIGGDTDLGGSNAKGSMDALEAGEQLEAQADSSPLRRGHGLILGLVLGGRYFGNSSFGGSELAGVDLRYSFSRMSTILLDVSIGYVNGTGTVTSLTGPGVMGGYEARIPLNARVDDALLLGASFRYESLSESSGFVFAVLEPEGHFGYRHVFGPSLGLEFAFDGGAAFASVTGLANSSTTEALLGGHVALLLGF
jgi:hypothetical protein